jgi:hypothetical protein
MKVKVNESTGIVSYTDLSRHGTRGGIQQVHQGRTVQGTSTLQDYDRVHLNLGRGPLWSRAAAEQQRLTARTRPYTCPTQTGISTFRCWFPTRGMGSSGITPLPETSLAPGTVDQYTSAAGEMVDYYFFYGPTIDQVIAGYRTTTGPRRCSPSGPMVFSSPKTTTPQPNRSLGRQGRLSQRQDPRRRASFRTGTIGRPYSWGSHIMDPSKIRGSKTMMS